MIYFGYNKNFKCYSNNNFSFSESIELEDSENQKFQFSNDNFENLYNNLGFNFLGKKRNEELLPDEYIKSQYSQNIFISERDNEIKENKQKDLNLIRTENMKEEDYIKKKIFKNNDKTNEHNKGKLEKKKLMFIVKYNNDNTNPKRKRRHTKYSFDNIISKIQIHFISFIINLVNDVIKTEFKKEKYFFVDIAHKYKKIANSKYFQSLKKVQIKEILQKEITKKSSIKNKDHNKNTCEKIFMSKNNYLIKEILNMNYLDCFTHFYYNNGKEIDAISIGGKIIKFSEETRPFYKLYIDNDEYNQELIKSVQRAYFETI